MLGRLVSISVIWCRVSNSPEFDPADRSGIIGRPLSRRDDFAMSSRLYFLLLQKAGYSEQYQALKISINITEQGSEIAAHCAQNANDRNGDQGGDEAIFDRRGARFIAKQFH
jgi:hypothetical protein